MRYHSCNKNSLSSVDRSFPSRSVCCHSILLPQSRTSVCEVCLNPPRPGGSSSSVRCSFPSSVHTGRLSDSYLQHCCLHPLPVLESTQTATSVGCSNFLNSYSPFSHYSACCRKVEPQLNESSVQTKEGLDEEKVPLLPSTSASPLPQEGDGFTGLRCRTNRTLRFYLLDVALNWPLAVRLGATGNTSAFPHQEAAGKGDGSFAAIVNLKDEVHYVLHRSPAATLTESLGKKTPFPYTPVF